MKTMIRLLKSQDGATAIEYALIAALISVVAIAAIGAVGGNVNNTFNKIASGVGANR